MYTDMVIHMPNNIEKPKNAEKTKENGDNLERIVGQTPEIEQSNEQSSSSYALHVVVYTHHSRRNHFWKAYSGLVEYWYSDNGPSNNAA